jgi:3-hydroxyacyl-CoA dehydrogenase
VKPAAGPVSPMEVKTIAVIGAGLRGRSIALAAATTGYQAILEDVSDVRLEEAKLWIIENLRRSVAASGSKPVRRAVVSNFTIAHTIEDAIRGADLIIETLPDEMEMQIELFTILDKFAKPNAIFASTGHLSITELAEVTLCAERCIGMRFGEGETKTVTLTKAAQTSGESVAACSEVVRRFGNSVIVVEDLAEQTAGNQLST